MMMMSNEARLGNLDILCCGVRVRIEAFVNGFCFIQPAPATTATAAVQNEGLL